MYFGYNFILVYMYIKNSGNIPEKDRAPPELIEFPVPT